MQAQAATGSYTVSPELLAREEFQAACQTRDFAELFRLMRKYDGASQDRIASPVDGLTQSRVSRIIRGSDHIASLELIQRIADALHIPGQYLGLAPRAWEPDEVTHTSPILAPRDGHRDAEPAEPEPDQAKLSADIQDNHLDVNIDVTQVGNVRLTYRHEFQNTTRTPFSRLVRQFWFKHTTGPLVVEPLADSDRRILVQPIHDVGVYLKFACQIFPAIQPGETARIGYTCTGGLFSDELYWRQAIFRPTRKLSLHLRLCGVQTLSQCSALEEHPNGSEVTATESLTWGRDGDGTLIGITRYDLLANQAITLRWGVPHAPA